MAPRYRSAEALATDGGLVVAKDLPDSASGVKAFGQQEGSIEEEETSNPIYGILEVVDPVVERRKTASQISQAWSGLIWRAREDWTRHGRL